MVIILWLKDNGGDGPCFFTTLTVLRHLHDGFAAYPIAEPLCFMPCRVSVKQQLSAKNPLLSIYSYYVPHE